MSTALPTIINHFQGQQLVWIGSAYTLAVVPLSVHAQIFYRNYTRAVSTSSCWLRTIHSPCHHRMRGKIFALETPYCGALVTYVTYTPYYSDASLSRMPLFTGLPRMSLQQTWCKVNQRTHYCVLNMRGGASKLVLTQFYAPESLAPYLHAIPTPFDPRLATIPSPSSRVATRSELPQSAYCMSCTMATDTRTEWKTQGGLG